MRLLCSRDTGNTGSQKRTGLLVGHHICDLAADARQAVDLLEALLVVLANGQLPDVAVVVRVVVLPEGGASQRAGVDACMGACMPVERDISRRSAGQMMLWVGSRMMTVSHSHVRHHPISVVKSLRSHVRNVSPAAHQSSA